MRFFFPRTSKQEGADRVLEQRGREVLHQSMVN